MPTASRNERRKRRQRRNLSLITRELRSLNARHFNTSFSLLAVLKYMDGPITISKELAGTLMQEFHFLSWQADRQDDGSVIISLRDKRAISADAPDTTAEMDGRSPRSVTAQLTDSSKDDDLVVVDAEGHEPDDAQ